MSKSPTKPDHVANHKPVVTDLRQRREHAAWKLLEAVREFFPQKFAELEDLRGVYDTSEREEEEELDYRVWRWTEETKIKCSSVEKAALEFIEGEELPYEGIQVKFDDTIKAEEGFSAVEADPLHETLDEFLTRATEHYHRKRDFLARHGLERIRKRESDHFRYLALHRVGGYTWEQITEAWNQVANVTSRDLKTIAGEARKVAKLLGLAPGKRGRRPGSRDKRRRKPVVRRG